MHITVLGFSFQVPTQYSAGHVCTESEAQALQRYFNRHLAKGVHKVISGMISAQASAENVQARGDSFVFQFTQGFTHGHERLRAINSEARRIALQAIETNMYKRGLSLKSLSPPELEDMVMQLSAEVGIRAVAEERVRQVQTIAKTAHEDLFSAEDLVEDSAEDEEV
jgi:hypothetical protein